MNIKRRIFSAKQIPLLIVCMLSLIFSSWLMFHTFSYNGSAHEIRIAFKLWSDFGAHIPLIRSFSMGDNINRFLAGHTQYPIFPGEPIRYHFLFFLFVGILEKMGMRIDWALNIPSIIGFTLLMVLLYTLAVRLTSSKTAGVLTIMFLLFNGSLGFMRFFSLHPISPSIMSDIIHAKEFPAFAPWGPGEVSAFWNLNIYTNQRHLATSFAIIIGFILTCLRIEHLNRKKQIPWILAWSVIMGGLPYFHQPALLILVFIMGTYLICFPKLRPFLLVTGLITAGLVIPQLLSVRGSSASVEWYPGYIIHNELLKDGGFLRMISHLASFWWKNMGLHYLLIPAGFLLLPRKSKFILLPLIPLFIVPNLFKFTVEASANHKFFNFVMILGSMCTAYVVSVVSHKIRLIHTLLKLPAVLFIGSTLCMLTLTGIIDFFVVYNDVKGSVEDIPRDERATWIAQNTPKDAIFLNSNYLYHPASIAGRAIFLGWPYFAWSAGYKENRMPIMDIMYDLTHQSYRCHLYTQYHISYVSVENIHDDVNLPDIDLTEFLRRFTPAYLSHDAKYAIFTAAELCK